MNRNKKHNTFQVVCNEPHKQNELKQWIKQKCEQGFLFRDTCLFVFKTREAKFLFNLHKVALLSNAKACKDDVSMDLTQEWEKTFLWAWYNNQETTFGDLQTTTSSLAEFCNDSSRSQEDFCEEEPSLTLSSSTSSFLTTISSSLTEETTLSSSSVGSCWFRVVGVNIKTHIMVLHMMFQRISDVFKYQQTADITTQQKQELPQIEAIVCTRSRTTSYQLEVLLVPIFQHVSVFAATHETSLSTTHNRICHRGPWDSHTRFFGLVTEDLSCIDPPVEFQQGWHQWIYELLMHNKQPTNPKPDKHKQIITSTDNNNNNVFWLVQQCDHDHDHDDSNLRLRKFSKFLNLEFGVVVSEVTDPSTICQTARTFPANAGYVFFLSSSTTPTHDTLISNIQQVASGFITHSYSNKRWRYAVHMPQPRLVLCIASFTPQQKPVSWTILKPEIDPIMFSLEHQARYPETIAKMRLNPSLSNYFLVRERLVDTKCIPIEDDKVCMPTWFAERVCGASAGDLDTDACVARNAWEIVQESNNECDRLRRQLAEMQALNNKMHEEIISLQSSLLLEKKKQDEPNNHVVKKKLLRVTSTTSTAPTSTSSICFPTFFNVKPCRQTTLTSFCQKKNNKTS